MVHRTQETGATASQQVAISKFSRQASDGSIDIDNIERLISRPFESGEVENRLTALPAEQFTMPSEVNNSIAEMTMDDVEKLVSRRLESDDAESKSKKPDFNRQSSDLRTSCRLTSSERGLLEDLYGATETNSTSLPQDLNQEERARQQVEATANRQAAIHERLQEERLREEEQKAEELFMAAEAEKKRLQQVAVDNELKVIEAAKEETERQERERSHEADNKVPRKNETEQWERELQVATSAIDAAATTKVVKATTAIVTAVDEQPLPVLEAVREVAEVEVDQVAKLKKQIEEKKAALIAKAEAAREAVRDDAVKGKAADDAGNVKVTSNMNASDYTGKADTLSPTLMPPYALCLTL